MCVPDSRFLSVPHFLPWVCDLYSFISVDSFNISGLGPLDNWTTIPELDHLSCWWTFQNSFTPLNIVLKSGSQPAGEFTLCKGFQEDAVVAKWRKVLAWTRIKGRPTMVVTTTECSPHSDSRTYSVSPSLSGEDSEKNFSSLSTSVERPGELQPRSNRLSKQQG